MFMGECGSVSVSMALNGEIVPMLMVSFSTAALKADIEDIYFVIVAYRVDSSIW